jgi:hypothetical protein
MIWKKSGRDRYCLSCWNSVKGDKPKSKSQSKPIKKISDKQSKLNAAYSVLRKSFLTNKPYCEARLPGICTINSTDVHHMEGRGSKTLDTTIWLSVCRSCHTWITDNSKQAIELGLSNTRLKKDN